MTAVVHLAAALAYAAAILLDRGARDEKASRLALGLGVGALLHVGGIASLHADVPPVPLESFAAALSLIGWLLVVSYLLSLGFARVRAMGAYVAATAAALTVGSALGLWSRPPVAPVAGTQGAWSHAHVLLSTFGFSLLALSSLAGLGYLTKRRALKRRLDAFVLPSLESLDRVEHLGLALGFPLLTLGVLTGFIWSAQQGFGLWTGHSLLSLAAWIAYLLPIEQRVLRRQHGDRPARLVVIGFAVLAVSYIGVRLLGSAT